MNNNSRELPLGGHISSADLWTIFTRCPIERGSVNVYTDYCRAKKREQAAIKE